MNRIKTIAFASVLIGALGAAQAQAAGDGCIDTGLKATQESTHGAGNCQSDRKLTSGERDLIWTMTHPNR